jgi:sec-independent protein translocase protein TatA
MPFGLGFGETVIIFAVFLLLFGAKRLPELASGMGKGIREFKRSINGLDENAIQTNTDANYLQAAPAQPQVAAAAPAAAAPAIETEKAAQ